MTRSPVTDAPPRRRLGSYAIVGIASMMGTTIEWYDFFLYSSAAALIFNKLFFPNFDPMMGTLASFATYAVGFFARPFGGVLFGHLGDRVGRKSALLATLLLMGIPTTLMGLIPTYRQIGLWAAVLLVLLRLLQGIAVGGEWGGAALMSVEHAPDGKKGLFGSLPQAGVGAGLVLSSLAMAWSARLPEADLMSWGWRVPFVASALLVGVGWFIRVRVAESPVFEKMKATGRHVKTPLFEVLRHHPRTTLLVIGARLAEVTWFYTVVTFSLAYASNQLALPKSMVLTAIGAGGATEMCTIPLLGLFADRIGQKWLYALGTVGLIAFALPFFRLLEARNTVSVWLAIVPALAVVGALMYGQQATLFAAQFPAEVRYSGISLGVQVSGAIGGGLAPIVATGLLAIHGGSTVYVSLYLMALGAVALACVLKMRGRAYDAVEGTCSTS
jgi:MHS family shikimate/dehydroshikimate transporter-like MFS transporter